jgi:hypothetical protein
MKCQLVLVSYKFFLNKEEKKGMFVISFFYCAEWGYIVAFIKVLAIYQIYGTGMHPLHYSSHPSTPISGIVSIDTILFIKHFEEICKKNE